MFISSFWQQLFKSQGTILKMSSSYHPQIEGQTENLNKTLEMYLRCYVFDHLSKWHHMLPWAQYWYNTSFHHSIHMSPYKALFGRDPPLLVPYVHQVDDPSTLQETL